VLSIEADAIVDVLDGTASDASFAKSLERVVTFVHIEPRGLTPLDNTPSHHPPRSGHRKGSRPGDLGPRRV